jgi:hypothetical protein
MNINIRKLIENDISEVSALINDTVLEFKNIDFTEDGWKIFVDSNSYENIKYIINTPEYITYIAEDEEKIIGIITIRNFNTVDFMLEKNIGKLESEGNYGNLLGKNLLMK